MQDSQCSDDGNGWIVTNERYVVMPWKMVTRHGKHMGPLRGPGPCGAMTFAEAVDSILNQRESKNKELERRERAKERIEKTRKEYYKFKLDEIREAPVDSRPRKLSRLYQINQKNRHLGVTITTAGTLNPVNYPGYPPELTLHEYEDNEEGPFYDAPKPGLYDHKSDPEAKVIPEITGTGPLIICRTRLTILNNTLY